MPLNAFPVILAKGAGAGIGPTEMLVGLMMLGTMLVVGALVGAVLFRAAIAIYIRFAGEDAQLPPVSLGKALLIGFIHGGAVFFVHLFAQATAGVLGMGLASTLGGARMPLAPWLVLGVMVIGHAGLGWFVKALLATGFIPCRFGMGALIGLIWIGFEGALYATVAGVLVLVRNWP